MPKKLDLTGQRFGRLVVIEPAPNKGRRTQWKCMCDCGNEYIALTDSLRSGRLQSCGCLHSEKVSQRNYENADNLIGQRFGKLVVIERAESRRGRACWKCQCDCGNIKEVCSMELKRGETLSCGCIRSSFGETKIASILDEAGIIYKREYEFKDLVSENGIPLRYDFAILNQNGEVIRIVEYDGEQHFLDKTNDFWKNDSLEKRQARDKMKNMYCYHHNIPLVRIPYTEKNRITLNMILGDNYLVQ